MDFFLHIVRVNIWHLQFPPFSIPPISMCEYWSCALQSKLSRPPEISRCRAFTWIIVVPVNRVTRVVQQWRSQELYVAGARLGHKIISESLEILSALQTRVFIYRLSNLDMSDRLSYLCNLTFVFVACFV